TGLCVGLTTIAAGKSRVVFYVQLVFNDLDDAIAEFDEVVRLVPQQAKQPRPKGNALRLEPGLCVHPGTKEEFHPIIRGVEEEEVKLAKKRVPNVWRPVALEVTPDEVRACWGDKLKVVARLSAKQLRDATLSAMQQKPGQKKVPRFNPVFAPQGGVGLVTADGTASFRHVVLEPLP